MEKKSQLTSIISPPSFSTSCVCLYTCKAVARPNTSTTRTASNKLSTSRNTGTIIVTILTSLQLTQSRYTDVIHRIMRYMWRIHSNYRWVQASFPSVLQPSCSLNPGLSSPQNPRHQRAHAGHSCSWSYGSLVVPSDDVFCPFYKVDGNLTNLASTNYIHELKGDTNGSKNNIHTFY